ncbi:leucine-rich repeat-containing protein kinase family protein [Methylobacterium radiodurans]|uniref:Protein kinase n=1 Tax=Methylobacterium radiodurans TaxID=2202828 RepID=A0A2U8VWX5_9HYPH|nr:leucine-rich repeat-containing protein kinase family protein [Methylobacterium radiodurans]AWN38304.1 protein kinase [Methylobacterium radiodurans]
MTEPADTLRALRRGDLAGARVLRLPPGLAEFPTEIFGLADTLELLDIGGSPLCDLPPDLSRLRHLRVLFCSGGRFACLPPVLGDCPALEQIGCRGAGVEAVPAEALPPRLRWLTLTDNRIAALPAALGERPMLQKLMLSGNRLSALPDSLAGAPNLELLRIAANRFAAPPVWLAGLPRLAWLACAGNPFEPLLPLAPMPDVPWDDLEPGALLGEGASGRIHAARWRRADGAHDVALKLFKGTMTSDGLPEREMAACLAAGAHPNLSGGLGRLVGHPESADGLLMPLLPAEWRALAGPPSLASCSRDVYDDSLRFAPAVGLRLARAAALGAAHLHARGLMHGDLYAHNLLWDGSAGAAVLSDFGAACALPEESGFAFQRVEVRAWGLLLGEILDRCDPVPAEMAALRALERACVQPDVGARPLMAEVVDALDQVGTPEAG